MANSKDTMECPFVSATGDQGDQNGEKYALRPRSSIKRQKPEQYQPDYIPKRPRRIKPKSTPLTKYRRKTANARERHRMKVINTAFEALRKVLPDGMDLCAPSSSMTKISTLRLAVNYIQSLSNLLENDAKGATNGKKSSEGVQFTEGQKDKSPPPPPPPLPPPPVPPPSESPSSYTLPQTVPQVTAKNPPPNRCPRPTPIHYTQPSSYYFGSGHVPMANTPPKAYAFSPSSSPSVRGSLSSTSDLEELLSDDSEFLEDNFDVFRDIPSMASNDPFEVLLEAEKTCQPFTSA